MWYKLFTSQNTTLFWRTHFSVFIPGRKLFCSYPQQRPASSQTYLEFNNVLLYLYLISLKRKIYWNEMEHSVWSLAKELNGLMAVIQILSWDWSLVLRMTPLLLYRSQSALFGSYFNQLTLIKRRKEVFLLC